MAVLRQKLAKERQREILEKELATEQQLLANARKEAVELDAMLSGEEPNDPLTRERLQPYRDNVHNHEQNVQALRRELRNLDR